MNKLNSTNSPIGLKTELCLIELILLMAKRAAERGDAGVLSDLEDYITQSYLTLGYTETDYVISLREYVETLRQSLNREINGGEPELARKRIVVDLREVVAANADKLDSLFSIDEEGHIIGLYGRL